MADIYVRQSEHSERTQRSSGPVASFFLFIFFFFYSPVPGTVA